MSSHRFKALRRWCRRKAVVLSCRGVEGPVKGAERTVSGATVQATDAVGWLTGFPRRLTAAEQRVIIRLGGDESARHGLTRS